MVEIVRNNGMAPSGPGQEESATEKDWWYTQYRQMARYFLLLCFLLTIGTLLQSFYMVQITLVFQSQTTLQEAKLKDLMHKLGSLNQTYHLLFIKYPALNQYCPVTNNATHVRECRPCPEGWVSFMKRCYMFSQERADWITSQYRCMALGGTLAMVKTEEEQVFLWRKAKGLSQGDSYWLGLRSSSIDGGWQWTDGFMRFWDHGPEKGNTGELCARLSLGDNYRLDWHTTRCTNHLKRICEKIQGTLQ